MATLTFKDVCEKEWHYCICSLASFREFLSYTYRHIPQFPLNVIVLSWFAITVIWILIDFCCNLCRCVEHLLHVKNRANASKRDKQGYSPVHYAAARGHKLALEMVCCTVYHIQFCFVFSFSPFGVHDQIDWILHAKLIRRVGHLER